MRHGLRSISTYVFGETTVQVEHTVGREVLAKEGLTPAAVEAVEERGRIVSTYQSYRQTSRLNLPVAAELGVVGADTVTDLEALDIRSHV